MKRNTKINLLLLLAVVALAVLPLALGLGDDKEEPFAGADGEAEAAITEIEPDYEPWFSPLYEPPSAEIESGLFALQAAIGAGALAYYFGVRRGRRQGEQRALARQGTYAAADERTARTVGSAAEPDDQAVRDVDAASDGHAARDVEAATGDQTAPGGEAASRGKATHEPDVDAARHDKATHQPDRAAARHDKAAHQPGGTRGAGQG
ncbi:energy-coupling factor ABC transporter substrate-binding protein [Streptomyces sp. NBC_00444]|uniref:energy-coupling factor ABC transporter substrate-binding protein n=1 Tax=Streptomyces sp. NBC_00444 TaxID=2975744 RepID=UPI0030E5DE76